MSHHAQFSGRNKRPCDGRSNRLNTSSRVAIANKYQIGNFCLSCHAENGTQRRATVCRIRAYGWTTPPKVYRTTAWTNGDFTEVGAGETLTAQALSDGTTFTKRRRRRHYCRRPVHRQRPFNQPSGRRYYASRFKQRNTRHRASPARLAMTLMALQRP